MNRAVVAAFGLAITAIATASWLLISPTEDSPSAIEAAPEHLVAADEVDIDKLQKVATESCFCERSGGGSEEQCWKEYRDSVVGFEVNGYGTACAPVSTSEDCIQTASGEKCVVTGYDVNAAADEDRDVMVCTEAEAQAIEAAASAAWLVDGKRVSGDDQAAWDRANDRERTAIANVLDRIREGEKFSPNRSQEGCV